MSKWRQQLGEQAWHFCQNCGRDFVDKAERERRSKVKGFIARLVEIKAEAGRLQMWRTLHALDAATHAVGFEYADQLTGKQAV